MRTSELTGVALDWAVAKCEMGEPVGSFLDGVVVHPDYNKFYPSRNWAQGGPIIERERMDVDYSLNERQWYAHLFTFCAGEIQQHFMTKGPTPLIAAMRTYVASKLGDDVDIPEELL